MTNWVTAILLTVAALLQSAATPSVAQVLRDLADGNRPLESARLETECGVDGRLTRAAIFGSGVAIWNGERQGMIAPSEIRALLDLFVRERFAGMRAAFGEDEGDKVKMTCLVRFADVSVNRTVVQLADGRQSAALKRLADSILARARAAAGNAPPVASLDGGLQAIAGGTLAVETLHVTLRSGVAGARPGGGWVMRLDGRDMELEDDGGTRVAGRLEEARVREIARAFAEAGVASLPVNLASDGYAALTVTVLGHELSVQARPFAGRAPDAALRERFTRAIAPLVALRDR